MHVMLWGYRRLILVMYVSTPCTNGCMTCPQHIYPCIYLCSIGIQWSEIKSWSNLGEPIKNICQLSLRPIMMSYGIIGLGQHRFFKSLGTCLNQRISLDQSWLILNWTFRKIWKKMYFPLRKWIYKNVGHLSLALNRQSIVMSYGIIDLGQHRFFKSLGTCLNQRISLDQSWLILNWTFRKIWMKMYFPLTKWIYKNVGHLLLASNR